MRKAVRRRPQVEGLESMVLLSGGAGRHAELGKPSAAITGPLMGSASGNYRTDGPGPSKVSASGNVSPIGRATFSGIASFAILDASGGRLDAKSRQGKMTLNFGISSETDMGMGTSYTGSSFAGTYSVVKASKALRGEVGTSGSIGATIRPISTSRGSFTLTFS